MWKTSIATSPGKAKFTPLVFAGNLKEGLRNVSELGYDAIELSINDPEHLNRKELLSLIRDNQLQVSAIATGRAFLEDGLSLIDPDEEVRIRCRERIKDQIRLASLLDCKAVIIGGIRGKTLMREEKVRKEQVEGALACVRDCAQFAAQCGVVLPIEPINRYETDFINTLAEAIEFIDQVGQENVRLLIDTFHMNIEERTLVHAIRAAGKYIKYVHFADSNRWAPGCGHLNFQEVVRVLQEIGYEGFISAEILPRPDDTTAAELAIRYFRNVLGIGRERDLCS